MKETKFKQTEIGMIPEDWDILTIDDIKSEERHAMAMGPFGSNIKKENFTSCGVHFLKTIRTFCFKGD